MANNVSNVSFSNPAYDYAGELSDIERRKALAQVLQAQGMAPGGGTKMAGAIAIRNSPLEGLAKALQTGVGEYANYDAKQRQADLTKKAQTDLSTTLTDAMRAYTGTPATAAQPDPSGDIGFNQTAQPAVAGDPMAAALRMMQNPQTAGMAGPMMQEAMKGKKLAEAMSAARGGAPGAAPSPGSQPLPDTPALRFMTRMGDTAGISKYLADNPYAKIDPSKFTPDSLAAFKTTGDQSVLRPIEQGIMADMGNGSQLIGRNTGAPIGKVIQRAVSPNTQATLTMDMFKHLNLSENQKRQLAIALQNANTAATNATNTGIETKYNTGDGVFPPGGGIQAPQGMPTQPIPGMGAPAAAPQTGGGFGGFPSVTPAVQAGRNADQVRILQAERARLSNPADIADIDREIAKLSGRNPFAMTPQGGAGGSPLPKKLVDQAAAVAGKPLPGPALKLQQDELDAIGTGAGIAADMAAATRMLSDGKLNLGPVTNLWQKGRNYAGFSSEESRNFASFQATLEKLRNDSLRLNKGTQTEGDAQRAWNELASNINDKGVVMQRLREIQQINDRAINLRKMSIDQIRGNYGHPPLDTGKYENQPAAIGATGNAPQRRSTDRSVRQQADAILGM